MRALAISIAMLVCLTTVAAVLPSHRVIVASTPSYSPSFNMLDAFLATEASPLASPRNANPGPGVWAVTANDGTFQIVNENMSLEDFNCGNTLKWTAQSTPTQGDLKLESTNAYSRTSPGMLAMITKTMQTGGGLQNAGFSRSGDTTAKGFTFELSSLTLHGYFSGTEVDYQLQYNQNVNYELCVIARPTSGAYALIRGGIQTQWTFPDWTLVWVDDSFSDSTCFARIDSYNASGYCAKYSAFYMDSTWSDQWKLASYRSATTTNGQLASMNPDSVVEHTITAATGVTQELVVRQQNSTNKWIIRMSQAGSTIKLIELVNAVETERKTAAQTWNNGTSYRVVAVCFGNNITATIGKTAKWIYSSAANFNTSTGVTVSDAGTNLAIYPCSVSLPGYATTATIKFLTIGDSKTQGLDDSTPPSGQSTGFQRYLADGINTNGTIRVIEAPYRIFHAGYTVNQIKTAIDSDLATAVGNPDYVLLNIGANDCSTTIDASFDSDYAYILDAIHVKYPSALVYVMQIWHRSCSSLANIRSHASTLVAARSPWAFNGPDEAVFLENGDDGATYTADGIHPNHAGYLLTALKWRLSLGL